MNKKYFFFFLLFIFVSDCSDNRQRAVFFVDQNFIKFENSEFSAINGKIYSDIPCQIVVCDNNSINQFAKTNSFADASIFIFSPLLKNSLTNELMFSDKNKKFYCFGISSQENMVGIKIISHKLISDIYLTIFKDFPLSFNEKISFYYLADLYDGSQEKTELLESLNIIEHPIKSATDRENLILSVQKDKKDGIKYYIVFLGPLNSVLFNAQKTEKYFYITENIQSLPIPKEAILGSIDFSFSEIIQTIMQHSLRKNIVSDSKSLLEADPFRIIKK